VKTVKNKLTKTSKTSSKGGFLLRRPNFVAEQRGLGFDDSPLSWKAGTLPLSYSRKSICILSPILHLCQSVVINQRYNSNLKKIFLFPAANYPF
jgi:hypothetical protein